MLDFSKIKTPASHGEVVVLPEPAACGRAVRSNAQHLRAWDREVVGAPLSHWRRKTREALAGTDDVPVIVIGHQPAFYHPGVWAKHVVARRLADAWGGVAVNIVVDNDAPRDTTIAVPSVAPDRVSTTRVSFAEIPHGFAYEQLGRWDGEQVARFQAALREAMGSRYDDAMLPRFFEGVAQAKGGDWVDQVVEGRRAMESTLGVSLVDHRVSGAWCSPLLIDMLQHAKAFAQSYNRALVHYRQRYNVRGGQRPIPDLHIEAERCELPVWIYRANEARRRLLVHRADDTIVLYADDEPVGEAHVSAWGCDDRGAALIDGLNGWRLRPRALALTLWARLLLADFFIHGIGGAKYDRITNEIISDYYGREAPYMGCVSGTLHLDLPLPDACRSHVSCARRQARDLRFNPQRHLSLNERLAPLVERRERAVASAQTLKVQARRDRAARRRAFQEIRSANAAILETEREALTRAERAIEAANERDRQRLIAQNREYFFGLYPQRLLEQLMDALPASREFRV